jgi:hypothetical protein
VQYLSRILVPDMLSSCIVDRSYGLATKSGGANGEAAGGPRLRGMRHTDSHF